MHNAEILKVEKKSMLKLDNELFRWEYTKKLCFAIAMIY